MPQGTVVPMPLVRHLFEEHSNKEIIAVLTPNSIIEDASVSRVVGRWMLGAATRGEVLRVVEEKMH